MDAQQFAEAIAYEHLTRGIYNAILRREGLNIEVEHDLRLAGKSGVEHQVDVHWRFSAGGVPHRVLVECKHYSSPVTLESIRSFFGVLHDIGNCQGLMVTKTGYQAGVVQFAGYYGIGLKLLRRPTEQDWEGRVKNIRIDLRERSVVSTDEKPIRVKMALEAADEAQRARLTALETEGKLLVVPATAGLRFFNRDRSATTGELRWWLPAKLPVLERESGGPYTQAIPLKDEYVLLNPGAPTEELVRVSGLSVEYYVEEKDWGEVSVHGEDVVEAVLSDRATGAVEYVKKH